MNKGFTVQNLTYSYAETQVIRGIDLTLRPGRFYGILGPNGCGKTTLLDLLAGFKKAEHGRVILENTEITKIPKKTLATKVALVPQEFELTLGFSVEEIVMMGRHPHIPRFSAPTKIDYDAVAWAIEKVQLTSMAKKRAADLSGGQKQRTIVARALAQQTQILLFDEATANLDVQYSLQIFRLVKTLIQEKGHTVIAVLHNLNLAAAYCDDILFMKDGKKHCFGPTAKVMTADTIYDVFGVDAKVGADLYGQKQQVSLRYL